MALAHSHSCGFQFPFHSVPEFFGLKCFSNCSRGPCGPLGICSYVSRQGLSCRIGQQCFRCETAWTSSVCGAHTSNPSSCVALGIGGGSSSWLYLAPWQLDIVTSWWKWAVVLYSLLRSMLSGQGDVVTSCTETLTTESALNAFLETQSVWLA